MPDRAGGQVLITGAAGALGRRITRRFLEAGCEPLLLWLHARDEAEFEEKERALRSQLGARAEGRVQYAWGDLQHAEPFGDIDSSQVTRIVHCAAVTRFNVERELAERVNVAGTVKLLDFAMGCAGLERFALLSSVYSSGLQTGEVREEPLASTTFANHYEWSKWEAERALLERYSALPWQIFRAATAIADDAAGRVSHQGAFHNTLKLLYYGLLSLVPGREGTPVYFVTLEFIADAVHALVESGAEKQIYHVCHTRRYSLTLGQLIEIAFERFERDEDFRARRILRPLFCDAESFELLAEEVDSFGGGVVRQGLLSVKPFARQLFAPKSLDNTKLVAAYARYRPPDVRNLVASTCDHLVATKWGRRPGDAH